MDGNQRMIAWSAEWALIGGVVACTGCMQSQPISKAEEPFPHDPSCAAKDGRCKSAFSILGDQSQ
jgi:hypothetical protein